MPDIIRCLCRSLTAFGIEEGGDDGKLVDIGGTFYEIGEYGYLNE